MTREEAIKHFKEQLDIFGGEHAEAIKVAIEALQNKSRPFGDCSKCIHTYGTLGCCTTVSNEWVYDCEHGMEQYENTSVPSAGRPMVIKCKPFLSEEDFKAFAEQASDQNVILISNEAEVVSTNTSTNTSTKSTNISTDAPAGRPRPIEPTITVDLESGVVPISAYEPKAPKTIIYADRIYAERPRGEWIETAQDYYETVNKKGGGVNENTEYFTDDIACSECLTKFSNIDNETERYNFCPNCGADMKGGDK